MNEYLNFFSKIFNFFGKIGNSFYKTVIYDDRYKYILEGLLNTIIIALFAVIIGIIIGIIVALIRNNFDKNGKMKLLNTISKIYVNVIRGTPVMLQLMIIYYVIFYCNIFLLFFSSFYFFIAMDYFINCYCYKKLFITI